MHKIVNRCMIEYVETEVKYDKANKSDQSKTINKIQNGPFIT